MGSPRRMINPVSIAAVAGVSLVRGGSYIASGWIELAGTDVGPVFPYFPTAAMGAVWLFTGLFLLASMWKWSWFRLAISLQAGMYATWFLVSIMDIIMTPDWVSVISAAMYGALVPIAITLAGIETTREVTADRDSAPERL